jgi:MYXO-CTERM domain-containing protein
MAPPRETPWSLEVSVLIRTGITVAAATLLLSSPARADRPQPRYVVTDPAMVDSVRTGQPLGVASNVIYLNGCFAPGDCTFTPGAEDSVTNRSSIIEQTSELSPFEAGDTAWAAVVECVQRAYLPFNVVVTDVDPSPAPHFEAVVAGSPDEVGFESSTGGVSPFTCGVINNAVTYSFANIYQGSIPDICWTVAQESAHAFGLDHEFLCEDPLTYLSDCGSEKWFRNQDVPCGEYEPRDCMCAGPNTQNSFATIRGLFGAGTDTPPTVSIVSPADGDNVRKGFVVTAQAADDIQIDRVELLVNNQLVATVTEPPFAFTVPPSVSDGVQQVQVAAYDIYEAVSRDQIEVVQGVPCDAADECLTEETCVDGRCVLGPGTPGGLGESCTANEQCASGQCGDDGSERHCAEQCDLGGGGCPDGFGCRKAGDVGVCWPGYDEGGGGCAVAGGDPGSLVLLGLGLLALGARRRRGRPS